MKESIVNYLKNAGVKEEEVKQFSEVYDDSVKMEAEKQFNAYVKQQKANELTKNSEQRKNIQQLAEQARITR